MDNDVGKFRAAGMFPFGFNHKKVVFGKRYRFILEFDSARTFQNKKRFVKSMIYFPRIAAIAKMRNGTIDRE